MENNQNQNQNNFRKPYNQNMGEFRPNNPNKKIPNPANFKIVKCKNYERGKVYFLFFNLLIY
jgi:hypothetical protein